MERASRAFLCARDDHRQVLKHIAKEARVQAAHMRLGTRMGNRRSGKAWRKILSDVDDTLTCSGEETELTRKIGVELRGYMLSLTRSQK